MRPFRIRPDLDRAVIDGFSLALGLVPSEIERPTEGYTVDYTSGEDDEPDTYAFHVVVSHEKLAPLIDRAFRHLPDEVYGIVEIGSRDAYRSMDVYMGQEAISIDEFRAVWKQYEPFLLEDGSIAAGANSEVPFVEVFLDQWKGLSLHVPLSMRDEIEEMLAEFDLHEVTATWPEIGDEALQRAVQLRSVLARDEDDAPDVDDLLFQLRYEWRLDLNVDPDCNIDDADRELGQTLWHAMVVVESTEDPPAGAYVSIWATAGSLAEMEDNIDQALSEHPRWEFTDIFTIDRVAYDERPDELVDLSPRRDRAGVHLVQFDEWSAADEAGHDPTTEEPARG